jgi:hypothetical protein
MQMAFGAMLINAAHSAREDRIIAFDSIRVRQPLAIANVLASRVVDPVMAGIRPSLFMNFYQLAESVMTALSRATLARMIGISWPSVVPST